MKIDTDKALVATLMVGCGLIAVRLTAPKTPAELSAPVPTGESEAATVYQNELDLTNLEYVSLREESSQAREAQQAILTWSLAAFAAVFAAGLLFVSGVGDGGKLNGIGAVVFYAVFALALPSLAIFAFLSWCGELIRMERAGSFMRGLEISLARTARAKAQKGGFSAPLRWETFLHRLPGKGGKQRVGYLGSLGIYFGTVCLSLIICCASIYYQDLFPVDSRTAFGLFGWSILILVLDIALTVYLVLFIQDSGENVVAYEKINPADMSGKYDDYVTRRRE